MRFKRRNKHARRGRRSGMRKDKANTQNLSPPATHAKVPSNFFAPVGRYKWKVKSKRWSFYIHPLQIYQDHDGRLYPGAWQANSDMAFPLMSLYNGFMSGDKKSGEIFMRYQEWKQRNNIV